MAGRALFLIFLLLSVTCALSSYSRGSSNKFSSQADSSIQTSVSESELDSSESDESDDFEIDEDIPGPEENPKCDHAAEWPIKYPTCRGLHQSPINIKGTSVKPDLNPVSPLCWKNYDAIPVSQNLFNAGHTIQMSGVWRDGEIPTISCGILGDYEYQFVQWHCHWAKNNHNGSDHTFNGRPYPMECHFVHFRTDYGTFQNASTQENGIAVVALVFDMKNTDTFPIDVLGPSVLRLVRQDNVSVMPLPLGVYAPTFTDNYVTYHGSLTTPPCSESVIWIINIKAQNISQKLMKKFRCVAQASECLKNNFRNVQEINGRDIILVPDKKFQ